MKPCKAYSKAFISRFADNEIPAREQEGFIRHMETCPACAGTLAQFRRMALAFDAHAIDQAARIQRDLDPISLPRKDGIIPKYPLGFLPSGKFGLKLASIGAAAVVLAATLYSLPDHTGPSHTPSIQSPVPSAIVNSVDTYGSSVMILENPDTRHTIIWFSET